MTRLRERVQRAVPGRDSLVRTVFGDRLGLLLFLTTLIFVVPAWRIGFFINDNWTLANTFVAVADGHLHLERIVYGADNGATPGMHLVDGRLYGRNYGQLVIALPALWLLGGLAAVADPALVLVGGFCLLVLAWFVQLGRLLDREPLLSSVGATVALLAFGVNVLVAVDLRPYWFPFAALQLSTMVASALVVVIVYRVLRSLHGRRVGAVAAAAVALSSPVAFWATIPKRHTLTALFVLVSLLWFLRSRDAGDPRTATRHHALAYVPVGLLAWIHAAEGILLLTSLLIADLLTIRRIDPRRLAVVAAALAASLTPMLATNWLISGDPLTPPRLLPVYYGNDEVQLALGALSPTDWASTVSTVAHSQVTVTPTPGPGDSSSGTLAGTLETFAALLFSYAERILDAMTDGDRLYRVFVRSGYIEEVAALDGQVAVSLSFLESMPILGGLVAVPLAFAGRVIRGLLDRWSTPGQRRDSTARHDPVVGADVFVVCISVLFLALYLPQLPSHVSWTVRYIHPLYPLGVYALFRVAAVRETVDREWRLLGWSYAGTVLVGGQAFVLALATLEPTVGEAVQLHALVSAVIGGATAAWAVAYTAGRGHLSAVNRDRSRRTGAVVLGVACGVTTTLLVLWAVAYFPHSPFALPAVGEPASRLPFSV
ncbi:hypothetical protein BRC81_00850 [Halobacteriales archaeon QS_1_68_20]|nr:MAG: hypothetical protein BRC81_00850 [Halobacteriales archaeon QS_1_68_20]